MHPNVKTAAAKSFFLTLLILLSSCESLRSEERQLAMQPKTGPMHTITIVTTSGHSIPVSVEIADTEQSRAQGLMYRHELPPQHGMLFVFPSEIDHGFWMKNTYIPLDMLFIDQQYRIVGIVERAEPMTLSQQSVHVPSRYVLEVNGGFAQAHGITIGGSITGYRE